MRHLLLVIIFLFPLASQADRRSCTAAKYENYAQAKSDYQKKLTKLIISKHPEFESITTTYMNDQLLRIEKNLISFNYLLENTPTSLDTTKNINRWVRTTDTEEQKIAATNQRYAVILNEITLSEKRPYNPAGDDLRKAMRTEIMLLDEFKNIAGQLSTLTSELSEKVCD